MFDYDALPNKASLDRYIKDGVPLGDFLRSVVSNNLAGAVGRADLHNLPMIPTYVAYLYNEAPSACWGSEEKYEAWLEIKSKEWSES